MCLAVIAPSHLDHLVGHHAHGNHSGIGAPTSAPELEKSPELEKKSPSLMYKTDENTKVAIERV